MHINFSVVNIVMESNPRRLLDEFIPEALGKQFVIPVYQRKYTWTVKKQLIPLMKDLVGLIEDDTKQKQHFLGTVVYLENVIEYKTERSIVDGQQRIVTMFLIAHAMKSIADNEFRAREIDETYLQNYSEPIGSRYRQRLYPSVADGNDYLIIAEGRYEEIDKTSSSNIVKNFLYLQSELRDLVYKYGFELSNTSSSLRQYFLYNVVCSSLDLSIIMKLRIKSEAVNLSPVEFILSNICCALSLSSNLI